MKSLEKYCIVTLIFLSGIALGVTIALKSNLDHDEKIRTEVWNDAVEAGVAYTEINPTSGYVHYYWMTKKKPIIYTSTISQ